MPNSRGINGNRIRPKSSLSEHVAKEIQRDYHPTTRRPVSKRGPIRAGARRIKTFVIATAGGVKRVTVATGRQGVRVGGQLKRSMATFTRTLSNSTFPKKSRRRKHRLLKISKPIWNPELSEMSPFFAAESSIESVPSQLNPAASIDELLRAYGVRPGKTSSYMPPPPARAIFPPGHKYCTGRVHVRSRPRSARPVSRSSSRPFSTSRPVSRCSSHAFAPLSRQISAQFSMCSYESSEVLGLSTLHEAAEEFPTLNISTLTLANRTPCISDPTLPEVRSRTVIVQVISQGTQTETAPPPPQMRTSATNTSIDLSVNAPNCPRDSRSLRNRERSSTAVEPTVNNRFPQSAKSQHLNVVTPGILFNTPNYSTLSLRQDAHEIAPDDNHLSLHQVESAAQSMDQYYRARQRDIARKNSLISPEVMRETSQVEPPTRGRAPLPQYRNSLASENSAELNSLDKRGRIPPTFSERNNGEQNSGRKNSFDELQREQALFSATASKEPPGRRHRRREATVQRFSDPSSSSTQPEFTASLFTPNYLLTPNNSLSGPSSSSQPQFPPTIFSQNGPPTPRNSLSAPTSTDASRPRGGPLPSHSVPIAARISGGTLSLTADRYRGAKTPVATPTSRPPTTNGHQRIGGGLSMDTTASGASESDIATVIRRDSFGQIWHSPLLQGEQESYWRGTQVE